MTINQRTGVVRWETSPEDREGPVYGHRVRRLGRETTARFTVTVAQEPAPAPPPLRGVGTRYRWIGREKRNREGRVLSPGGVRCPPDPLVRYPVSGDVPVNRPHREGPFTSSNARVATDLAQEAIDRLFQVPWGELRSSHPDGFHAGAEGVSPAFSRLAASSEIP